jgi:hypothetical protein
MVLGMTYNSAAAPRTGWDRSRPVRAFRKACLAALTLAASVVAGEDCSSSLEQPSAANESSAPELLPAPEKVDKPVAAPAKKKPKSKAPSTEVQKPSSVLLPPIQSLPDFKESSPPPLRPSPSQPAPPQLDDTPPTLLDPPPLLGKTGKSVVDTDLDVVVGQPRVLTFPDVPHRVALAVNEDDPIATLREVPHRPREWYLIGKKPGLTYLDVWLPDSTSAASDRVLHYRIRIRAEGEKVANDPPAVKLPAHQPALEKRQLEKVQTLVPPPKTASTIESPAAKAETVSPQPEKSRRELASPSLLYQTLEEEINRTFPGCAVHLKQVGEKLVVSGTTGSIFEATRILTLARENAPGHSANEPSRTFSETQPLQTTLDNYAKAGGPHVINLLRIPGKQQIMLHVVVAEVSRSAARSLGLDFGIADKKVGILPSPPSPPGGSELSSTVAANGWMSQLLRTLQDHHYAQALAEPTLTTLNGQAARFQLGRELPVPVVSPSSQGPVQSVAYRSYGVRLSIQPVIAGSQRIRLAVEAEVSGTDPQETMQVGGSSVPGLKVRNFQSTVELQEGETLAVAGLMSNPAANMLPQNNRPGAAEPPSDRELVVLISPLLPHAPSREGKESSKRLNPQEIERYLRNRNTVVTHGDALYLIGPQGYAGSRSH